MNIDSIRRALRFMTEGEVLRYHEGWRVEGTWDSRLHQVTVRKLGQDGSLATS
jgi:hypothetical protein